MEFVERNFYAFHAFHEFHIFEQACLNDVIFSKGVIARGGGGYFARGYFPVDYFPGGYFPGGGYCPGGL